MLNEKITTSLIAVIVRAAIVIFDLVTAND